MTSARTKFDWGGCASASTNLRSEVVERSHRRLSTDLVYELTARGDIPCLKMGRRKLIPRRAIEMMVDAAVDGFDPREVTGPRSWAS